MAYQILKLKQIECQLYNIITLIIISRPDK